MNFAPTHIYRHRVPLNKPKDMEKTLILLNSFKKEEEILEIPNLRCLMIQKKIQVKISYFMFVPKVIRCIYMVSEGKKAVKRHVFKLTRLNLERKACQREGSSHKGQNRAEVFVLTRFWKPRSKVRPTSLH